MITLKGLASPGRRRRPPRADRARGPGGSRDAGPARGRRRRHGTRSWRSPARRRSWTGCASGRSGASACTASTARSWSCRWTTSRCSSATGSSSGSASSSSRSARASTPSSSRWWTCWPRSRSWSRSRRPSWSGRWRPCGTRRPDAEAHEHSHTRIVKSRRADKPRKAAARRGRGSERHPPRRPPPSRRGPGTRCRSRRGSSVAKTPGVLAEDHLAEAGRKVLRFHLARMVAREAGTRTGKDAEDLHAMRVATRRQRAAWRVFGEAFDADRTNRYRRRLKAVAARPRRRARPRRPDRGRRGLRREADRGRGVRLRAACSTPGGRGATRRGRCSSTSWTAGATGAGSTATWRSSRPRASARDRSGPTEPHRVRDSMPSRVWAAYEACRAYEPVMRWADVTTLHDLRIAAKWLRYTLEFVREALGSDAGPVIERVVALQDHLGWLHDADVAANLARAFLVEHAGDLTEARERGDRALPRRPGAGARAAAADRRPAVARRVEHHLPARARTGGRRTLGGRAAPISRAAASDQPPASRGSRSRQAGPAAAVASSSPLRIPSSDTWSRSAANRSSSASTISAPAGRIRARSGRMRWR